MYIMYKNNIHSIEVIELISVFFCYAGYLLHSIYTYNSMAVLGYLVSSNLIVTGSGKILWHCLGYGHRQGRGRGTQTTLPSGKNL
jgi:hypothetical protein